MTANEIVKDIETERFTGEGRTEPSDLCKAAGIIERGLERSLSGAAWYRRWHLKAGVKLVVAALRGYQALWCNGGRP